MAVLNSLNIQTLYSKDFQDLDVQKLLKVIHQLCYLPSGFPTEEIKILLQTNPNFKAPPKSYGTEN